MLSMKICKKVNEFIRVPYWTTICLFIGILVWGNCELKADNELPKNNSCGVAPILTHYPYRSMIKPMYAGMATAKAEIENRISGWSGGEKQRVDDQLYEAFQVSSPQLFDWNKEVYFDFTRYQEILAIGADYYKEDLVVGKSLIAFDLPEKWSLGSTLTSEKQEILQYEEIKLLDRFKVTVKKELLSSGCEEVKLQLFFYRLQNGQIGICSGFQEILWYPSLIFSVHLTAINKKMLSQIANKLMADLSLPLHQMEWIPNEVPSTFVKTQAWQDGNFLFQLNDVSEKSKEVYFEGFRQLSETSPMEYIKFPLYCFDPSTRSWQLPIREIYRLSGNLLIDDLPVGYCSLVDGCWDLRSESNEPLSINWESRPEQLKDGSYDPPRWERNQLLSGSFQEPVLAWYHVGAASRDRTEIWGLSFQLKGARQFEVSIIGKDALDWEERLSVVVQANKDKDNFFIPLSSFEDFNAKVNWSGIESIVFHLEPDPAGKTDKHFQINHVKLKKITDLPFHMSGYKILDPQHFKLPSNEVVLTATSANID